MMNKAYSKIILCICLISNFNCSKDVSLPKVSTLGVKENNERWNGINQAQFVYIGVGKVISDGGGDITSKGFCYSSTNELPTINDAVSSENVDNNESFISKLNLQKGQIKYFLRAFAKNKTGISYGETVTYTTYCGGDWDIEYWYSSPPSLLSPSNGANGLPLSVELMWIQSTGGSYDLYLDTSPYAETKIASDVKSSSFKIDNLKPSITYYWKVIKRWTPCTDISSATYNFTTSP